MHLPAVATSLGQVMALEMTTPTPNSQPAPSECWCTAPSCTSQRACVVALSLPSLHGQGRGCIHSLCPTNYCESKNAQLVSFSGRRGHQEKETAETKGEAQDGSKATKEGMKCRRVKQLTHSQQTVGGKGRRYCNYPRPYYSACSTRSEGR
jgi:hypothetical protein